LQKEIAVEYKRPLFQQSLTPGECAVWAAAYAQALAIEDSEVPAEVRTAEAEFYASDRSGPHPVLVWMRQQTLDAVRQATIAVRSLRDLAETNKNELSFDQLTCVVSITGE
jgi:hypothetical protein